MVCRHAGRRPYSSHSHSALLARDVRDPEEALAHGVSTAVRSVLHHRRHGVGGRRARRTAARRHTSAGVLRQGQSTHVFVSPLPATKVSLHV